MTTMKWNLVWFAKRILTDAFEGLNIFLGTSSKSVSLNSDNDGTDILTVFFDLFTFDSNLTAVFLRNSSSFSSIDIWELYLGVGKLENNS